MKVSVVILNWNGCDMLRTFLPSVVRYSEGEGIEVCVADNGSTDASVTLLQQEFPSVRTIVLDQNYGFADGYNLALQQVDAEYVVLLNSDVEVTEHWLEPMIAYLDNHPEVAACQPKIRSQRQKEYFEYAGAAGGFIDKYGYPFCRGRIMGVVEKDEGQYDTVIPVFWANGAGVVYPVTRDYVNVGGLDGRFLLTWKKQICAGDFVRGIVRLSVYLKVLSIMQEELLLKKRILVRLFLISVIILSCSIRIFHRRS